MKITQASGDFRASFDLTDFGSTETWRDLCDEYGLERVEVDATTGYEWVNEDGSLVVQTSANPITGQKEQDGIDMFGETREGYASYIHIHGEIDQVRAFYNAVHARATHVKDSWLGEWGV